MGPDRSPAGGGSMGEAPTSDGTGDRTVAVAPGTGP